MIQRIAGPRSFPHAGSMLLSRNDHQAVGAACETSEQRFRRRTTPMKSEVARLGAAGRRAGLSAPRISWRCPEVNQLALPGRGAVLRENRVEPSVELLPKLEILALGICCSFPIQASQKLVQPPLGFGIDAMLIPVEPGNPGA